MFDDNGNMYRRNLVSNAMGVARNLTYNEPIQGAAKHMLLEMCHELMQSPQDYRVKTHNGKRVLIKASGQARPMTMWENFLHQCFCIIPTKF